MEASDISNLEKKPVSTYKFSKNSFENSNIEKYFDDFGLNKEML